MDSSVFGFGSDIFGFSFYRDLGTVQLFTKFGSIYLVILVFGFVRIAKLRTC